MFLGVQSFSITNNVRLIENQNKFKVLEVFQNGSQQIENIIMMGYSNSHTQKISNIILKYKVGNIRFLLELLTIT